MRMESLQRNEHFVVVLSTVHLDNNYIVFTVTTSCNNGILTL